MGFTATLDSMTWVVSATGIEPAITETTTVTFTNMIHAGARLGIDDETEAIGMALDNVDPNNRIVLDVGALALLLGNAIDPAQDVPTGDENDALRESVTAFQAKLGTDATPAFNTDNFLDVDRSAGQTVVVRMRLGDQVLFRTRPLSVQCAPRPT